MADQEKTMKFDLNEYREKNTALLQTGQAIDPANAEVEFSCQQVEGAKKFVRVYAARKPPIGPWIDFHDLEDPIQTELWNRLESGHMVRAGAYLISVDDPTARAELIALRLQEQAARDALKQGRIEAGKVIDAATAEMAWQHAKVMDPYGDGSPDLPHANGWDCVGRVYFARAKGGIWVGFGDLPTATREALWARKKSKQLMFPNGMLDPDVGWLEP